MVLRREVNTVYATSNNQQPSSGDEGRGANPRKGLAERRLMEKAKEEARTEKCEHQWVATTTHPYFRCQCGLYGLRRPGGSVKVLSELWHAVKAEKVFWVCRL
jgi:hypothetical protein